MNSNNKTINIHINAFGNENIDYITRDVAANKMLKQFGGLIELITMTHFDPNHPENHNVYISNKKLPHATIMEKDGTCKLKDKSKVIEQMTRDTYNQFKKKIQDTLNLSSSFLKVLSDFEEKFEETKLDDPKYHVYQEVALALYNNRDMIRSSIKNSMSDKAPK